MKQGAGGYEAGRMSLCSRAYELVPLVVLGKYGHGDKSTYGRSEDFQWMQRRLPMDVARTSNGCAVKLKWTDRWVWEDGRVIMGGR